MYLCQCDSTSVIVTTLPVSIKGYSKNCDESLQEGVKFLMVLVNTWFEDMLNIE